MANDVSKGLLRHALRNSGLENPAHEPDDIENENIRNIAKLSISEYERVANANKKLLKMIAESENNQAAKILLEHKADIQKKRSVTNKENASHDRKKKPSKAQLLECRDEWIRVHSYERGWRKAAKNKFNISYQTINSILEEV